MINFHPLEVVGRGSETQLKVGENLNDLTGYGLREILTTATCNLLCSDEQDTIKLVYTFGIKLINC